MSMNAYSLRGNIRTLADEVRAHVAKVTGCTVVQGFASVAGMNGVVPGGERAAGFMETSDPREWHLPFTGRSLTWRTEPVPPHDRPRVAFALAIGFGNGSPLPQPSGHWTVSVNGRHAVAIRVVKHSQLWRGDEAALAFSANRIESAPPYGSLCLSSVLTQESFAAFGPALLAVPSEWLEPGKPAVIRVESVCRAPSTRWFQLSACPNLLMASDIYRAAAMLTDAHVPSVGGNRVFFGDIHTHSGEIDGRDGDDIGCGVGTRLANYRWARDAGGMDFYALTDHECQIAEERTGEYLGLADSHNEEGRFVCLPAFEFTSPLFGHRNVYFRDTGGVVVNSTRPWGWPTLDPDRAVTPEELWSALERCGVSAITVPHHTSAASHPWTPAHYNPSFDRLIEVYSSWGSSEYLGDFPRGVSDRYSGLTVRDALAAGLRYGMIASSDGHDGCPGDAQSALVKHHHIFHHLGSGRAAVLCSSLTRHNVFDALHARRCYATTGPPIVLQFEVDGAVMGSELPALATGRRPNLHCIVRGTNGLDHVRIVRNGRVALTMPCHGERDIDIEWEDPDYREDVPSWYFARVVQQDLESAWSSPIWVGRTG